MVIDKLTRDLFVRASKENTVYEKMVQSGGYKQHELEKQRERFASLYDFIVDEGYGEDYRIWKRDYEAANLEKAGA